MSVVLTNPDEKAVTTQLLSKISETSPSNDIYSMRAKTEQYASMNAKTGQYAFKQIRSRTMNDSLMFSSPKHQVSGRSHNYYQQSERLWSVLDAIADDKIVKSEWIFINK